MATVYLARDLKHDRPVAIKVLRVELAAALGTERFLREIEIASRLQHPNILGLIDSGSFELGGVRCPWARDSSSAHQCGEQPLIPGRSRRPFACGI